ncbi:MerR family transcriptional regulator [Streptomyces tendae]|uniref:MerR family transcriptional regulator n=1 Tax=Streptomyces tendae TaxID=1932 RepID=UPI0034070256
MHFPVIPRRVKIGDAAAFAGTTPRAIRHYHAIGLLPEPERGADDRRRYGYDDMIRLLWIRKMADAGIALEDIRTTFEPTTDIEQSLARLEESLAAQAAAIERQRAAVRNWRESGNPLGLLSPLVTGRVRHLPAGALRQSDLDTLLVTERIFGPLGAAVQADRFIVLATHPGLRAEDDRLTEAETALDDSVDPDDPRVEEIAAQWCAHELAVGSAIEEAGLDESADELFAHQHDETADPEDGEPVMSALQAIGKMPYDFSPARVRCMERAMELLNAAHETNGPASGAPGAVDEQSADGPGGSSSSSRRRAGA